MNDSIKWSLADTFFYVQYHRTPINPIPITNTFLFFVAIPAIRFNLFSHYDGFGIKGSTAIRARYSASALSILFILYYSTKINLATRLFNIPPLWND
jgi:hypothetical protein